MKIQIKNSVYPGVIHDVQKSQVLVSEVLKHL